MVAKRRSKRSATAAEERMRARWLRGDLQSEKKRDEDGEGETGLALGFLGG